MTESVSFDAKNHWETVYTSKAVNNVSWYQDHPSRSLDLILRATDNPSAQIIDVGSGTTRLIGALLDHGYQAITALDISETALSLAQTQLGERANRVQWLAADVCRADLPAQFYDVWHDRAVFHFLTNLEDRSGYI